MTSRRWDAFISHASEDKAAFVTDLARELGQRGLHIWYDEDVLEVGDSVRKAIDEGLRTSEYGIVVISPDYMRKDWTNRELDGLLAMERGEKRLLPVWHKAEFSDVEKYSPTVAGRYAVRSAIGVPAVADALCRAMKRGAYGPQPGSTVTDPAPGPTFTGQLHQARNARVYAWIVIGTEREGTDAFTDDQIETYSSWVASLEPRAEPRRANSRYIWMTFPQEQTISLWAADVRPGPVVSLLTAMRLWKGGAESDVLVSFDELAGWWGKVIETLPALAGNLGISRVRLGFGLYPYGPDGFRVVGFEFSAAPQPVRRAEPHQIAPWDAYTRLFDPYAPPADILAGAVKDLLDTFSYGRLDDLQAWVAAELAVGSLGKHYRGPAEESDGRAGRGDGTA